MNLDNMDPRILEVCEHLMRTYNLTIFQALKALSMDKLEVEWFNVFDDVEILQLHRIFYIIFFGSEKIREDRIIVADETLDLGFLTESLFQLVEGAVSKPKAKLFTAEIFGRYFNGVQGDFRSMPVAKFRACISDMLSETHARLRNRPV